MSCSANMSHSFTCLAFGSSFFSFSSVCNFILGNNGGVKDSSVDSLCVSFVDVLLLFSIEVADVSLLFSIKLSHLSNLFSGTGGVSKDVAVLESSLAAPNLYKNKNIVRVHITH